MPKACKISGCGTKSHARGLCNTHYRASLRAGKSDVPGKRDTGHGTRDKPSSDDEWWDNYFADVDPVIREAFLGR